MGKKRVIYTKSLTLSHSYINKCPTHRHLVWTSVSVFSFMVITHKLFINRGINRCTLVELFVVAIDLLYLFHSDTYAKWFVLVTKTRLQLR